MEENTVQTNSAAPTQSVANQTQTTPPQPIQQPSQPIPPAQTDNQTPSSNKKYLFLLILIIILTFLFFILIAISIAYKQYNRGDLDKYPIAFLINETSEAENPNIANLKSVNKWKTFTNVYQNYSIKYPQNFLTICEDDGSCVIGPYEGSSKIGKDYSYSNQLSVIPLKLFNESVLVIEEDHANGFEYYDERSLNDLRQEKEFYDLLLNAAKNEEKIVFDKENYVEILPDTKIGTINAKVLKSSIDSYYGSYDKYYIVENSDETYLIIGSIDEDASEKTIDNIVKSYRIIDNSATDKIIEDLTKELDPKFSDIEINYIFDNYAEGLASAPVFEDGDELDDEIFREGYGIYAVEENGKWKIIWKQLLDSFEEEEMQCIKELSNIENLPIEINCDFDDNPFYFSDL